MTEESGGNAAIAEQEPDTAPAASLSTDNPPTITDREGSTTNNAEELSEVEVLRIENARLKRELEARIEREKRIDELNAGIKAAEAHVERTKADYKAAKKRCEESYAELHAFTSGDVQVQIGFGEKDDGTHTPGATKDAALPSPSKFRQVCGTYGAWQFATSREKLQEIDNSTLRQIEPALRDRKVGSINILGDKLFLPLEQQVFEDGSGFFDLWPLLDPTDWDATCADKYAHALQDLGDESPDITAKRATGGKFCGYMVKNGRRRYVVGPDDQVVRIVFGPNDEAREGFAAMALWPRTGGEPEVLSFPKEQLPDRMAERLREYEKSKASNRHEAYASALANDLKVEVGDIVAAADADMRFDVFLNHAGEGRSEEVVRLLEASDFDSDEEDEDEDGEPELLEA